MATVNQAEENASTILGGQGFAVERLERADGDPGKRADFRVTYGAETYVLEVTSKEETQDFHRFAAELRTKGIATMTAPPCYNNSIDGILRRKHDQIVQTPTAAEAFGIIWIELLHDDGHFIAEVIEHTVYGLAELFACEEGHCFPFRDFRCYYYDHYSFYRMPRANGVMVLTKKGCRLFVNAKAENYSVFKGSRLYRLLKPGMIDPEREAEEKRCMLLGPEVDRQGQHAKWEYLKRTYGYLTTRKLEGRFSGAIMIDADSLPPAIINNRDCQQHSEGQQE